MAYRRKLHQLVQQRGRAHPGGRLHWGGLKDFADGSLGSRTALMHQPYADDPMSNGVRLTPRETLQEMVTAADLTGLQVRSLLCLSMTCVALCALPLVPFHSLPLHRSTACS